MLINSQNLILFFQTSVSDFLKLIMNSEERSKKESRLVSGDKEEIPLPVINRDVKDNIQAKFLNFDINTIFLHYIHRSGRNLR